MRKKSYLLIAFVVSLTLIITSCDKEETCPAEGTWSLSYFSDNQGDCVYSCSGANQMPSSCEYIEPADSGCVLLTITEDGTYIISDEDGWTASGNWMGNCGLGEQVSIYWDGDLHTAIVSSLSSSNLQLEDSEGTYHFTK